MFDKLWVGKTLPNEIVTRGSRCLYVALPLRHFLKCLLNLSLREQTLLPVVVTYSARCIGKPPCSRRGSISAPKDDASRSILLLNTKGLTANKISVIEQLAYKNKAFIVVLQETHCTSADKLSDFQLLTSWVSPEQEPRPCHV